MKDIVIFRKFKDGEIIALFPHIKQNDFECSSYMHIGQHGGANYNTVLNITKIALPGEYKDLARELKIIGYDLEVRKKYIRNK